MFTDKIKFLAYNIINHPDMSQTEQLKILTDLHYNVVPTFISNNPDEIKEHIKSINKSNYDYDIDGIVLKCNLPGSFSKFGETGHHPLNAIALKFETDKVQTVITGVDWQVGRGKITPVIKFNPVRLNDTTVSKASAHNWGLVEAMDLRIGSIVEVEKANEIIPHICRVIESGTGEKIMITHCPSCGSLLKNVNGQLFCTSDNCGGKFAKALAHLAGKSAYNIPGLSIATSEKLISTLNLQKLKDVFSVTKDSLLDVEGFADKSAEKLFKAIQKAKTQPLNRFLYGLGIETIGERVSNDIANTLLSYDKVINDIETGCRTIKMIDGIGDVSIKYLTDNIKFIKDMASVITITDVISKKSVDTVYTFVITGTLSQPRDFYKKKIENAGHKVSGSVSKKTSYLLSGADAGSKLSKAQELGITIISEDELNTILG